MISARSLLGSVLLLGTLTATTAAQSATDIYLGTLTFIDGRSRIDELRNITNRNGYDNQPSFSADGRGVLYTSIRDGQADTYYYDIAGATIRRVTLWSPNWIVGSVDSWLMLLLVLFSCVDGPRRSALSSEGLPRRPA